MTVLLTGATGFVGSAFYIRLIEDGIRVRTVARVIKPSASPAQLIQPMFADLERAVGWHAALHGVSEVVHLAARAHVMDDQSANPLEAYRQVNVSGTLNLARQAAKEKVRRFVFVSSVKVLGEATEIGKPFTADDNPSPSDPYALSKLEAELGLRQIESETGMEVVIVRPPLVYGPGVKANFAAMMRLLARGTPLPLGAVWNARSMVALDNLVDLLVTCLKHPAAAGETFLVSDGEDVSTTELLHRTARAMGKRAFLLPVPVFVLRGGAALIGKRKVASRLCDSLQVDSTKTRRLLCWTPPLTLDQGLAKAVEGVGP